MSSLTTLKDVDLLTATKAIVQKERVLTTQVLQHLAELERRKLYCDLGYGSLFDYAVGELKYSEAAAGRRIQAMRLIHEIPEVAPKIESGALNLSNICQAQSFFREAKKTQAPLSTGQKKEILEKLEHQSAREGQRLLCSLGGPVILPRERERAVSPEHTEVSFVMSQALKAKLTEVRALLGARAATMNLAELISEMAGLSIERLTEKRFGQRRVRKAQAQKENPDTDQVLNSDVGVAAPKTSQPTAAATAPESAPESATETTTEPATVAPAPRTSRHIPRALKHQIWQQAHGKCAGCNSQHDLQFDHVQPVAFGGDSSTGNLQLLCRSCNLRRGVQTFGAKAMHRA